MMKQILLEFVFMDDRTYFGNFIAFILEYFFAACSEKE